MTTQPIPDSDGDEVRVHPLGEPEPAPFADDDAAALDELEAESERPLTDEERVDLLAGILEMPFAGAGWWLSRPHAQPLSGQIEAAWELPPASARRLARTGFLALPRTWRESRVLERIPILVFAAQLVALGRIRLAATNDLVDRYYQEAPDAAPPADAQPVSFAGRRPARGGRPRVAGQPGAGGADGDQPDAPEAGLGLRSTLSARAAERRERRRARAAAEPAE